MYKGPRLFRATGLLVRSGTFAVASAKISESPKCCAYNVTAQNRSSLTIYC